jgi:hypothetical protein
LDLWEAGMESISSWISVCCIAYSVAACVIVMISSLSSSAAVATVTTTTKGYKIF